MADVVVGATTDQQAAAPVAAAHEDELPYRVEAVAEITVGSRVFVMRDVTLGRSSAFLAAAGDAILGGRTFDGQLSEGIREARAQRQ